VFPVQVDRLQFRLYIIRMSSPLGRSAVFCIDIGCLLNLKFNHCSVVSWNRYISTRSSELSAKVAVLRDMLFFREDPIVCTLVYFIDRPTDEIATAIKCICTE